MNTFYSCLHLDPHPSPQQKCFLQFWELRSLAQTRHTTEEKQIKLTIRQVKYNLCKLIYIAKNTSFRSKCPLRCWHCFLRAVNYSLKIPLTSSEIRNLSVFSGVKQMTKCTPMCFTYSKIWSILFMNTYVLLDAYIPQCFDIEIC